MIGARARASSLGLTLAAGLAALCGPAGCAASGGSRGDVVYTDLDQGGRGPWSWVIEQACAPLGREVSGGLPGMQGVVFVDGTTTVDVDVPAFQARAFEVLRGAGDLLDSVARTPGDSTSDWILTGRVAEIELREQGVLRPALELHLELLERTTPTWTTRWSSTRRFGVR